MTLLALALVRGERCPTLRTIQLLPGLAVQVAVRFWRGEVLIVPGRAALIYSELDHRGSTLRTLRTAVGIGCAVLVGLVLFGLNQLLLAVPIGLFSVAFGGDPDEVLLALVGLSALRLTWTTWRAASAFRVERRRERMMVECAGAPRWRLELMGATPPRSGHGLSLLQALTRTSDAAGATVYLVCQPANHGFYRRAGFRTVPTTGQVFDGMLLMRRIAPARSGPLGSQRVKDGS